MCGEKDGWEWVYIGIVEQAPYLSSKLGDGR